MSTGLNFQTCTIVNTNKDVDGVKGNNWLFKAIKKGATKDKVEAGSDIFRVKRDFWFEKDNIESVYKAEGYNPIKTKITIDFTKLVADLKASIASGSTVGYARLDLNMGLEGSEEFLYASPWVQKGMPLWVDFTFKSDVDATKLADKLVKEIKKDKNFLIDHQLINLEANGGVLTLEGADEYQRIRKATLVSYNENDANEVVLATLTRSNEEGYTDAAIKLVEFGENGFGTYSHITRDLRLLTADNYQPNHLRQAETPILGAIYDQFIINYCAPASNDGTLAVGQRLNSATQHVFWVNRSLTKEFQTELGKVFEKNINVKHAPKSENVVTTEETLTADVEHVDESVKGLDD